MTDSGIPGRAPSTVLTGGCQLRSSPGNSTCIPLLRTWLVFLFETPSNTHRLTDNGSKIVPIPAPERYEHQVRGQYIGQREVIRTASENAHEVKDLINQAKSRAVMLGNNDSDGDRVPVSYKQEAKFEEDFWRRIDWKNRSEDRDDEAIFEYVRGPVFTRFTPMKTAVRPWGVLNRTGACPCHSAAD